MYPPTNINHTIFLLILLTCVKLSYLSKRSSKNNHHETEDVIAKRSLQTKTHNFLKNQPISQDLQDFIDQYSNKRSKRSEMPENQLYIIQNGQIIPLKDLKNFKREQDGLAPTRSSFKVVPLVVPIENSVKPNRIVQARNLDVAAAALAAPAPPAAAPPAATSTTASVPTDGASAAPENKPSGGSDEDNSSNNGTQEETQVLNKILQDIEGLMQWKHSNGNKKEGVICSVNGSWISDAAGMRFDINFKNSSRKKFRIHVADRIPPNEEGFLCDGNWSVFGELPFSHSGVIIVLAVHSKDKHLAMFIGECRVCEGSESVSGTWLIGRGSRDCKDQKASHKVLSDIWKKEEAHLLRKKHLKQLGIATNDNDD